MRMAEAPWMPAARAGLAVHNAAAFRTPSGAAPELKISNPGGVTLGQPRNLVFEPFFPLLLTSKVLVEKNIFISTIR